MRVRSDLWVKAYLRRAATAGAFGVVVRHGDDDAGAIFLKVVARDGTVRLFGPAPAGLSDADGDRTFTPLAGGRVLPEIEADSLLEQEVGYDGDLWIVEVATADGQPLA